MVAEALEKQGIAPGSDELAAKRTKIMEYLTALKDFKGVASRGFNDVGDGVKDVHVFEIKGGEWAPMSK